MRTPSTICCRMPLNQELSGHPFFIRSAQSRHGLNAGAEKERCNAIVACSHLPLAQCIQPPISRTDYLLFSRNSVSAQIQAKVGALTTDAARLR